MEDIKEDLNNDFESEKVPGISVTFFVGGEKFDVSKFNNLVGITPTRIWEQKIDHLKKRTDLNNFSWSYEKQEIACWSIEEPIEQVIEIFWPHREKILMFCEENYLSISVTCSIYIDDMEEDGHPLYDLSPTLMQKLSYLKAEFGMAFY